jgi:hypothetical protein
MKITIDIDCTPAEAREFVGLPDLRPLQAAWLAEIENRLIADMQKFSPEGIARSWLSGAGVATKHVRCAGRPGTVGGKGQETERLNTPPRSVARRSE